MRELEEVVNTAKEVGVNPYLSPRLGMCLVQTYGLEVLEACDEQMFWNCIKSIAVTEHGRKDMETMISTHQVSWWGESHQSPYKWSVKGQRSCLLGSV